MTGLPEASDCPLPEGWVQVVSWPYISGSDLVAECSLPFSLFEKGKGAKDPVRKSHQTTPDMGNHKRECIKQTECLPAG